MAEKDTGGPAFPIQEQMQPEVHTGWFSPGQAGMSLRDYFAGQALTGLCAAVDDYSPSRLLDMEGFAVDAYSMADAMLAERAKK